MSSRTREKVKRDIRLAIAYNRTAPVEPKALLWTDFPDTEDDLFGPDTREDYRTPRPIRRRRMSLPDRLASQR